MERAPQHMASCLCWGGGWVRHPPQVETGHTCVLLSLTNTKLACPVANMTSLLVLIMHVPQHDPPQATAHPCGLPTGSLVQMASTLKILEQPVCWSHGAASLDGCAPTPRRCLLTPPHPVGRFCLLRHTRMVPSSCYCVACSALLLVTSPIVPNHCNRLQDACNTMPL
jgi:hypothetical protein